MKREKFGSRLGFILISAGCAIGLGNVWRFPYITGQYGGAAFVLIYLFFLLTLGLPIMRTIRGCGICADLPVFPVNTGTSDHGHGVFSRACESGKYCAFL